MFDTYVTVYRPEGTLLTDTHGRPAQHLSVQVDRVSDQEQLDAKMMWNYDGRYLFKVLTVHRYPQFTLQQEDVLIDELNLDYDSGFSYKYRIINHPKVYPDHQLLLVGTPVGG